MEDDIYNGYFLPKDSIILGNAWCAALFISLSLSARVVQNATRIDDAFTFTFTGESCMTTGSSPIRSHSSQNASSGPT